MPAPIDQVLADPEFHKQPLGWRLDTLRHNYPEFSALSPKDQGSLIAKTNQDAVGTTAALNQKPPEDPGFWSTLGHDAMSFPSAVTDLALGKNPDTGRYGGPVQGVENVVTGALKAGGQQASKAKAAFKQGDYVTGLGRAVAAAVPLVGPMAAQAGEELGGGQPGAGAAHALEAVAPMAVPPVARAVGRGMQAAGVPLAESALGVRAIQRAYGKTPGVAALEETRGFRPATVAESARMRLGDINQQLETAATNAPGPASLTPARDVIDARIAQAQAGNSTYVPPVGRGRVPDLQQMRQQITQPGPGFAGIMDPATGDIAADQSPLNILRMKREFGKDFTKWNPLHPTGDMGTARNVYRALDQELDRTVPGAQDLNQRMSSLTPVAERAEQSDLNAGMGQRLLHRAAAHTGALVGAVAGYREAGIPGAVAGMVIPEIVASPATRMAAARGVYGAGRALASTPGQRVAQGASAAGELIRSDDNDSIARRMGRAIAQGQQ